MRSDLAREADVVARCRVKARRQLVDARMLRAELELAEAREAADLKRIRELEALVRVLGCALAEALSEATWRTRRMG